MILDLCFAVGLMVWGLGVGLRVMGACVREREQGDAWERFALGVPLGLGVLSLGVLGLGMVGKLTSGGIGVVLAAGAVVGLGPVRRFWGCSRRGWEPTGNRGWMDWGVDAAVGIGLVGTLLTALQPVTDGDALCYHLQVPKVFLWERQARFEPDLHETVYPLVAEMLDAVALAFQGPECCRLVTWVFGLVLGASTTALARPVLGALARWAGAVALLAPAVSNGMGAPLNDVVLAACANAALLALVRWWKAPSVGGAVLVGMLSGVAVGVKYPALVWVGLIGLAMMGRVVGMGSARKVGLGSIVAFSLVTVLVGGGWYLRAYEATGNPVYPFFREVFGAGLEEVLDPIKRPMEVTPWNLLTALGAMTLDPDRFDSVSHQFGPVFLLFLPVGLVFLRAPRRVWAVVGFGWVFLTLCLTQRQSMRFVLAALGPFSVGVAWVAAEWSRRGGVGRVVAGVLVVILVGESALAVGRARHGVGVLLGSETAEAYLARREPTFEVGRWIDGHLPGNARLIGQDHRGFYLPRPYAMELAHRRRTGLGTRGESAETIVETLREEGFTHLMLCPPRPETAVEFDPTLSRRLEGWLNQHEPVYERALTDGDGVERLYGIYELELGPEEKVAEVGRPKR